jgi:small subunit ribosomal protein S6
MNIECDQDTLDKLNYNFRFNDAVIRNLIISKSKAITEPSIMLTKTEKDKVEDKAKFKVEDKAKFKAKDKVEDKVEEKIEAKVEDTE